MFWRKGSTRSPVGLVEQLGKEKWKKEPKMTNIFLEDWHIIFFLK